MGFFERVAVIEATETESNIVDLGGGKLVAIACPTVTGPSCDLTFKAAAEVTGVGMDGRSLDQTAIDSLTLYDVVDDTVSAYTIPVDEGNCWVSLNVDHNGLYGARYIQVVASITQTDEVEIRLICEC